MTKVVIIGAGSGFGSRLSLDILSCEALQDATIALCDIDEGRLNGVHAHVNRAIEGSLRRCLKEYMSRWGRAFPIGVYPEEPRITRYRKGEGFYAWHSDNIGRSPTRVITAIWWSVR